MYNIYTCTYTHMHIYTYAHEAILTIIRESFSLPDELGIYVFIT